MPLPTVTQSRCLVTVVNPREPFLGSEVNLDAIVSMAVLLVMQAPERERPRKLFLQQQTREIMHGVRLALGLGLQGCGGAPASLQVPQRRGLRSELKEPEAKEGCSLLRNQLKGKDVFALRAQSGVPELELVGLVITLGHGAVARGVCHLVEGDHRAVVELQSVGFPPDIVLVNGPESQDEGFLRPVAGWRAVNGLIVRMCSRSTDTLPKRALSSRGRSSRTALDQIPIQQLAGGGFVIRVNLDDPGSLQRTVHPAVWCFQRDELEIRDAYEGRAIDQGEFQMRRLGSFLQSASSGIRGRE